MSKSDTFEDGVTFALDTLNDLIERTEQESREALRSGSKRGETVGDQWRRVDQLNQRAGAYRLAAAILRDRLEDKA